MYNYQKPFQNLSTQLLQKSTTRQGFYWHNVTWQLNNSKLNSISVRQKLHLKTLTTTAASCASKHAHELFFALAISASFLYFFLYENFVNIYTIRIRPFWDDPSLALLQQLGLSSTFPFSISFAGSETTSSLATVWVLVVVQSPSFRAWTDIFRVQIFLPVREAAHAWRLCVFCGNAGYRAKRRENTSVLGIPPQFFSDLLVLHLNTEIQVM